MKLQLNDAGSWRHLFNFDKSFESDVRVRAIRLLSVVNERAKLRVLDDRGEVKATCTGPFFMWKDRAK